MGPSSVGTREKPDLFVWWKERIIFPWPWGAPSPRAPLLPPSCGGDAPLAHPIPPCPGQLLLSSAGKRKKDFLFASDAAEQGPWDCSSTPELPWEEEAQGAVAVSKGRLDRSNGQCWADCCLCLCPRGEGKGTQLHWEQGAGLGYLLVQQSQSPQHPGLTQGWLRQAGDELSPQLSALGQVPGALSEAELCFDFHVRCVLKK